MGNLQKHPTLRDSGADHTGSRRRTEGGSGLTQLIVSPARRYCGLADDAVLIEPVSGFKFPANREINREFRGVGPNSVILASIQPATSMACSQIPYTSEQGIFPPQRGIHMSEQ